MSLGFLSAGLFRFIWRSSHLLTQVRESLVIDSLVLWVAECDDDPVVLTYTEPAISLDQVPTVNATQDMVFKDNRVIPLQKTFRAMGFSMAHAFEFFCSFHSPLFQT